jgi:hypothetical protein
LGEAVIPSPYAEVGPRDSLNTEGGEPSDCARRIARGGEFVFTSVVVIALSPIWIPLWTIGYVLEKLKAESFLWVKP